ncbi:MAG: ATP-binding cassette domain-containing protein [Mycoplasma sp.]
MKTNSTSKKIVNKELKTITVKNVKTSPKTKSESVLKSDATNTSLVVTKKIVSTKSESALKIINTPHEKSINSNNQPILSVKGLNKFFVKSGKIVKVLDDINFDVNENDFFGIIGESGSGKSTTGKCIIRLYDTSSGTITFDNKIINQAKMNKKSRFWLTQNMSMIFQDPMSSLNPRKNVLSLIAEPLIINKTIHRETKAFIEKCYKVNPYFQNTFKLQDYILTNELLIPFYKRNIKLLKEKSLEIRLLKLTKENLEELPAILDTAEAQFKDSIKLVNEYNQKIIELVDMNYQKFDLHGLHETENNYYEAEKNFLIETEKLKYPNNYAKSIKLKERIQYLENKLAQVNEQFHEKYIVENRTRLNSIKTSITSEMKSLKQDYMLTESLTDYTYKYTSYLILKDTLHALSALDKEIFIDTPRINELNEVIFKKVESKYANLMADIAEIARLNDLLDKYSLDTTNVDTITDTFNKYHEIYNGIYAQTKILKETNFTTEDPKLRETLKQINLSSRKIELTHIERTEKIKIEIHVTKEELKSITAKVSNSSDKPEYASFNQSAAEFENAKNLREIYITSDNAEFKSQTIPKIEAQKRELKSLDKSLYNEWIQLKKATEETSKKLVSLFSKKDAETPNVKMHTVNATNKLLVIDAINFEFKNLLSEVNLFRNLRNKSKTMLYKNWKTLFTYITRQHVYGALEEVGLKSEHAYRYPHEFSGGQRQRIVIARALISKPKLIIADEPISALDVSIQAQVINIMKDLAEKRGITFLFIAHDLSMVRYVSNKLIIMHKGRIVEKGHTEQIFKNPIHPYTKSLIKASPELSKIHVDLASFSSTMDYDAKYTVANQPKYFSASKDYEHFVFATKEQFAKWKK